MTRLLCALLLGSGLPLLGGSTDLPFHEKFHDELAPGWSWVRENPDAWRLTKDGLEIRIEPGNMWGPENSGKNVLVRQAPGDGKRPLEITVTVENRPTEQYEQVDLTWYYDDSHMVKIGQEKVDGQLSIVMGREEKDRARTIAIIPLETAKVQLRLKQSRNHIEGFFRPGGKGEWRKAGECDLPVHGEPKIALQCYNGPKDAEHWAKISRFSITEASR